MDGKELRIGEGAGSEGLPSLSQARTAACRRVGVMPGAVVGFAQLIWQNQFPARMEVVRVNLDDLVPSVRGESVGGPGLMSGVAGLDEFERKPGCRPRLPRAVVMRGGPNFTLVSPSRAGDGTRE